MCNKLRLVIEGIEYESAAAASRVYGISSDTVRYRVHSTFPQHADWRRWGQDKTAVTDKRHRAVEVEGVVYPSITAAAKALNISHNTMCYRLKSKDQKHKGYKFVGDKPVRAKLRCKDVVVVYMGKEYPTVRRAAFANQVSFSRVRARVKSPTFPDCYYLDKRTGKVVTP